MSSREGDTLSLYPSSAPASFPPLYQTMNATSPPAAGHAAAVVADHHSSDDDKDCGDGEGAKGAGGKSRRELPAGAVATLKAWLLSPEHFTHPYPTPQDQVMLMHKTGIDKKQLKNWFTNARRRIWKPMLKKQLEAGKLAAAGGMPGGLTMNAAAAAHSGGGMVVAVPPGLGIPQPEMGGPQSHQPPPQQEMYSNFQQAQSQQIHQQQHHQIHQQQQQPGDPNQQQHQYQQHDPNQHQYQQQQYQQQQPLYDQYGNQVYQDPNYQQYEQQDQQQYQQQPAHDQQQYQQVQQQYQQQPAQDQQQPQQTPTPPNASSSMNSYPSNNLSIGSLAPMNPTSSLASFGKMIKTDSHAVLMELFARDQDLVRQAAGKGGVQVQQAATAGQSQAAAGGATSSLQASGPSGNLRWASGTASPNNGLGRDQRHSVTFEGVPSLSSWPHFSSVSSLNNLGGLQGVKSIMNLSAADLSSQGNLNKMGNLAQVKSIENLGRGDSYAFLEVFFDDKSGLTNSSSHSGGQRGVKRDRDDDDAIGLSLDADDGASSSYNNKHSGADQAPAQAPPSESGVPTPAPLPEDGNEDSDGNGTDGGKLKRAYDDALAARGLIAVRRSCEKLTDLALPAKMQRTLSQEYIRQHNQGQPMGDFFSSNNSAYAPNRNNGSSQQLHQQQYAAPQQQYAAPQQQPPVVSETPMSDPNVAANASVEVPSSTKCTLCTSVNVDTQLRPCGHMFHGRCLKPSLQNACGPPKCPICQTSMQSAILAVPSAAGTDGVAGINAAMDGSASIGSGGA